MRRPLIVMMIPLPSDFAYREACGTDGTCEHVAFPSHPGSDRSCTDLFVTGTGGPVLRGVLACSFGQVLVVV